MSALPSRADRAESDEELSGEREPWPRGVSRDATLSIGQVVAAIKTEFPALTVSKIRFLEEQGLVSPQRSGAGYRKYSRADIERIRFILTQQRDSFAPLKVIRDQLETLDGGHDVAPTPTARVVASDGEAVAPPARRSITVRELSDLTGASREELDDYTRLGLVRPDLSGHFPSRSVYVVRHIRALEQGGVSPRLLRAVHSSAEREADIVEQSVASQHSRARPADRERARARSRELGEELASLHREMLRVAVETLNSE